MGNIVTVEFHGDQLLGFEDGRGIFVALKPIVEGMGMDWSAQYRRVERDPILSEGIAMMATPLARGGAQEAVCLKLDLVHGWLFTIDSSRIRDAAVRGRVLVYQRECYAVLARAFAKPARAAEPMPRPAEPMPADLARRLVSEARLSFDAMSARQLWFKLGLPTVPAMYAGPAQLSLFTYDAHPQQPGTQR